MNGVYAIMLTFVTSAVELGHAEAETEATELRDTFVKGRPRDCADLYRAGQNNNGVYNIFPSQQHMNGVAAYCDMESDGGGWTVIQRRGQFGNPVFYFYKGWDEYANGFGDPTGEYWIGNKVIHALTAGENITLRIQLKNHTGNNFTADYEGFTVAGEDDLFRVKFGEYRGDQGSDSLSYTNNMNFSTPDRDHDGHNSKECAKEYRGGWWYRSCHKANLNGLNLNGEHASSADGINWLRLDNSGPLGHYSYLASEMKIRDANYASHGEI